MSGITTVVALAFLLAIPSAAFALANLKVTSVQTQTTQSLPRADFIVNVGVQNAGNTNSVASSTKLFLVRTIPPGVVEKKNLDGMQNVGVLGPSQTFSSPVTVTVFSDTAPGTYQLQACADGGETNFEGTGETDNCTFAAGTIVILDVPDLVVDTVTGAPPSIPVGGEFTLTATVKNIGAVVAGASQVKYSLCTPGPSGTCLRESAGGYKIDLKNKQNIPALDPGGQHTNPHLVEVRAETVTGSYWLEACADSGKVVTEKNEENCLVLQTLIEVTPQPDLHIRNVTVHDAPLTINAGEPLFLSTVVRNRGALPSGVSDIKYIFVDPNNPTAQTPGLNLKDRPPVPTLQPLEKTTVATLVRTDEETLPGTYIVRACADSLKTVGETDESNNCTDGPTTMLVTVNGLPQSNADLEIPTLATPDLSNPPTLGFPGDAIRVTATVRNKGTDPTPETTTKFNLVNAATTVRKNLKGIQLVPGLAPGASSAVEVTLEIYSDTVPGTYFLEACADDLSAIRELKEDNNCRVSTTQVTVQDIPNLVVTALDDPPLEVLQNQFFNVKPTVQNTGDVTAPESTVKFYLVSLADQSLSDLKNTQVVPSLAPDAAFSQSFQVKVRPTTLPGLYSLRACADSGKIVPEPSEDDNCFTSAGTVLVKGRPDLIVNRITVEGVPVTVKRGNSFTVTSVVRNNGLADAGASQTKLYLVQTPGAAQKKALTPTVPGTQSVPALAPDTRHRAQFAVTVEPDTAPNTYHVLACADEVEKSVAESDENNNCTTSFETLVVTQ